MKIFSATLVGVTPSVVEVEIDISPGLPFFQIVGLPDAILKESRTRVKSAIVQGGFAFPYDSRVVLNLAPSKMKKEGSALELALAVRILSSSQQIPWPEKNVMLLGELALDGSVRTVPELEALMYAVKKKSAENEAIDLLVVPHDLSLHVPPLKIPVICIRHLSDLTVNQWWEDPSLRCFSGMGDISQADSTSFLHRPSPFAALSFSPMWARLLELAAVGKHHTLLCGPPGCGKTFFAESLKLLLEDTNARAEDRLDVLDSIYKRGPRELPWAAPHHSATSIGLLGGGNPVRPGAITKAHGGILFLDEMFEFPGAVLDALREPLERGEIDIFRVGQQVAFPARFQLVAATNPCRCGFWNHPFKPCQCQLHHRQQYQAKMSGPLFDRFDIRVFCKPKVEGWQGQPGKGADEKVRGSEIIKRVRGAHKRRLLLQATFQQSDQQSEPAQESFALQLLWSPEAETYLKGKLAQENFRRLRSVRRVSETIALTESANTSAPDKSNIKVQWPHVEEALSLQQMF